MAERSNLVSRPGGPRLAYARFGDPGGRPVFFMHGFPASRLEAALLDAPARETGVCLFAPDRPGFGRSGLQPDRVILDWPADLAALADALGIGRFWIVGGSAGCPYALACAHRLGNRVKGVAIVAGLGPITDPGVVRQMGAVARLGFALGNRAPAVFNVGFGALARLVARYPGLNYHLNRATAPDRETIARPEVRAILDDAVREAFRQGPAGAVRELALMGRPWGFDVGDLATPLHVWHGAQDGVVPPAMGKILAGKVAGARLRLLQGEGHVSLPVGHGAEILRILVSSPG